jgi:integrase
MPRQRRVRGEGSLFKRSDGLWVGRITLPNGQRKQVTGKTQAIAKSRWEEVRRAASDGLPIASGKFLMRDLIERFLDHTRTKRAPTTYREYKSICDNHLVPQLGRVPVIRLRQDQVDQLLRECRDKPLSVRTCRAIHAVLRATLSYAAKRDMVGRNVAALVEPIPLRMIEVAPLSLGDVTILLSTASEHPLYTLLVLALATGMRQGEILGLRWRDIDLASGQIRVQNQMRQGELAELKTEQSRRVVALPWIARQALLEHRKSRPVPMSDYVFTSRRGKPILANYVRRHFKSLLTQAELSPSTRFHDLRHTAVSFMLNEGIQLHEVSRIVGHSGVQVTANVYGHLSPERRREAADALNGVLARAIGQ